MTDYPEPDREILAAGIEWLYRTVQPEGAIIQHHGASMGRGGDRSYGFCPQGALDLPVISLEARNWTYDLRRNLTGGLLPGEMAATAAVLADLGVKIRDQWNGDECIHGSFGLAEPAHPSLIAAVDRYRADCPVHGTPFCGSPSDDPGSLGHDCTWYADGNRLIVGPDRPDRKPEEPDPMTDETTDRCRVIERDNSTGATRPLPNMAEDPWGDTFTREQAEASVEWRKAHITSKYSYEIRPVTIWMLDITTGDHRDLFMKALETDFREEDPFEPARVCVRKDGQPGGQVWAYTRRGVNSPPAWLVSLCAFFEDEGYEAGIRRP